MTTGEIQVPQVDIPEEYHPVLYPEEAPYWEGARRSELVLQRCQKCGEAWFPIGPVCPFCLDSKFTWDKMSGRGIVSSYVVFHKPWAAWLESKVPYAVVQVELEEGPRMTTNLRGAEPADVYIGMPVTAIWEQLTDEIFLLQFQANK